MDGVAYQDAKEPLSCSLEQTRHKPPALEDSIWFWWGAAKSSAGLRGLVQETAVSVFHQCPSWSQESKASLGMCWKSFCFHLDQYTILWLSTIKALNIYVNTEDLRTNWGCSSELLAECLPNTHKALGSTSHKMDVVDHICSASTRRIKNSRSPLLVQ